MPGLWPGPRRQACWTGKDLQSHLDRPSRIGVRFSGNRTTLPSAGKTPRGGLTWARIGHDHVLRANLTARRRARHHPWHQRPTRRHDPSPPPTSRRTRASRTRCLEVQGNAPGIVLDVGFIGLLTRCRSGSTRMVATPGSYRRGGVRSWPSLRPLPPVSLPRAPSSPSRVYACRASLPSAVVLRSQTGLTANLQSFRIEGTGGWSLLQRWHQLGLQHCAPC